MPSAECEVYASPHHASHGSVRSWVFRVVRVGEGRRLRVLRRVSDLLSVEGRRPPSPYAARLLQQLHPRRGTCACPCYQVPLRARHETSSSDVMDLQPHCYCRKKVEMTAVGI